MGLPSVLGPIRRIGGASAHLHGPLGGSGPGAMLNVQIPAQVRTNWCWAAVTEGIWEYYAPGAKLQCEIASQVLGHNHADNCCCGGNQLCNRAYYLDVALQTFGFFNKRQDFALSPDALMYELVASRPVGIRIQWPSRLGHFVVASAIEKLDGGAYRVTIQDPWGPKVHQQLFADLQSNYDSRIGRWTHTYLTVGAAASFAAHASSYDPFLLGG